MNQVEEQEKEGLDVKFYPVRNRYLEKSVNGLSRILKFTLFLCAIIVVVVLADFSGYALEDVKALFSSSGLSELAESEENELFGPDQPARSSSMYAGHSISAVSPDQMHNRASLQTMLMTGNEESQNSTQPGYFGIDVSHWQQDINWEQVAGDTIPRKIDFSIVKATQGAGQVDPNFATNWKQSNDLFEIAGAYHFYIFSDDPKTQAQNFIQTASLSNGNLPPIVDLELNCSKCDSLKISGDQMVNDLKSYLTEIENHFDVKPIIYTNIPFFNKYLTGEFDDYPFWMAKYEKTPPAGLIGLSPAGSDSSSHPKTVMWQFSDYGRLNGIIGTVDMNFLPGQARSSIEFINRE